MTTEKFRNLAETTLASSYTAGAASISVTSAALFPTTGDFSIRVDNVSETILRVTAVSGTTFTVTAESNDGNASAGAAVVLVGSRKTAERFLQSPESGEQRAPSGVSAGDYYGPIHKLVALDQSGWSWVNQGSFTVSQGSGIVQLAGPAAAGTNLRCRVKTAPSVPYTITVGLTTWFATAGSVLSLQAAGLVFRESGTGELSVLILSNFTLATANSPQSISAANYNSPTSFNAVIGAERNSGMLQVSPVWLRITDNNTNLVFQASIDKVNWYEIASIGRTSFMAGGPDQVGIVGTNQAGSTDMSASFLSWEES